MTKTAAPTAPTPKPPPTPEPIRLLWQTYQLPSGDLVAAVQAVKDRRRSGRLTLHFDDAGHINGAEWQERVPKSPAPPQNPLDTPSGPMYQ